MGNYGAKTLGVNFVAMLRKVIDVEEKVSETFLTRMALA